MFIWILNVKKKTKKKIQTYLFISFIQQQANPVTGSEIAPNDHENHASHVDLNEALNSMVTTLEMQTAESLDKGDFHYEKATV